MLTQIQIQNFAIIDQLDVDFQSGLTVVTGETGAGKSIMIDALSLVLGDRADATVIRANEAQADITAQFAIDEQPEVSDWLTEQALDADGECLLRRVVQREGRSKAFINGRAVTLNMLRDLGEKLVDIHGQHAHQALSKRTQQRGILDSFGKLLGQAKAVTAAWQDWQEKNRQLQALQTSAQERIDRRELLSYQVQELESLQISSEELDSIEDEHRRLSHISELVHATAGHTQALYLDEHNNIYSQLSKISAELESLCDVDSDLAESLELIHSAQIQVQEAYQALDQYQRGIDQDPQAQQQVEERLSGLLEVARKHRIELHQLVEHFNQLADELSQLDSDNHQTEQLEQDCLTAEKQYLQLATALSKERQSAAKKLTKSVNHYLGQLGMEGGQFAVAFADDGDQSPGQHGIDKIEFMISANPGQPLQPLSKVASGGELSRMSLAIQVVTHSDTSIPCLIFDEVDVGIGGGTAEVVGNLLAELADRAQVLCVTHQAQVAAKGGQHFSVRKSSHQEQTVTSIVALEGDSRTEEIARMIGGIKITDQTLKYAKEMLN